jgi:hypothetical protein
LMSIPKARPILKDPPMLTKFTSPLAALCNSVYPMAPC